MTQAAHTPGPWTILNRGYKSHVTDSDMRWNAEVVGPGHTANARLIAAAPDLLAALEILVFDCEAHGLDDNDAHLREARAAIARAKGNDNAG